MERRSFLKLVFRPGKGAEDISESRRSSAAVVVSAGLLAILEQLGVLSGFLPSGPGSCRITNPMCLFQKGEPDGTNIHNLSARNVQRPQNQLTTALLQSKRTQPKRPEVFNKRLAAPVIAVEFGAHQRRIVRLGHYCPDLPLTEAQLQSRAQIVRRTRVVHHRLKIARNCHLDVPRDPVIGAEPIRKVRAIWRLGAAANVSMRNAVACRQEGRRELGVSDREGPVVLWRLAQHFIFPAGDSFAQSFGDPRPVL